MRWQQPSLAQGGSEGFHESLKVCWDINSTTISTGPKVTTPKSNLSNVRSNNPSLHNMVSRRLSYQVGDIVSLTLTQYFLDDIYVLLSDFGVELQLQSLMKCLPSKVKLWYIMNDIFFLFDQISANSYKWHTRQVIYCECCIVAYRILGSPRSTPIVAHCTRCDYT